MILSDRRYGRVLMPGLWLAKYAHDLAKLAKVMEGLLVLRAEFSLHKDGIDYLVWSENFSEVPPGSEVPEYVLDIAEYEDNVWRRGVYPATRAGALS